jgi:hypothetical protein
MKAGINPSREAKIMMPIQFNVVTGSSLLRTGSIYKVVLSTPA